MSIDSTATPAVILDPAIPLPALIGLAVVVGGFAVWNLVRRQGRRVDWTLRIVMVALLILIGLRPLIPADTAGPAAVGGLEVYFVVDTTSSMAAEDVAGSAEGERPSTRLDSAKADIIGLAAALPGAQLSLTTFDASAVQRVPVTSDASALVSATSVLTQESTTYSRGSSIDAALELMTSVLDRAATEHPDRARVLFYLGDGEQTRDVDPEPFDRLAPLISGGAVLGYGTADGGRMRAFDGFAADDDPSAPVYIFDPRTAADAISVIDERNLQAVANQLGVTYSHREPQQPLDDVIAGIEVGDTSVRAGTVETPFEFYWIFALPLAALALRELLIALRETLLARRNAGFPRRS